MAEAITRDAAALHRALEKSGSQVHVKLSRETAELVSRLVDAHARGEQIVVTPMDAEMTPTEAAMLLGVSRPQVRKLIDRGQLEFRMVGTHHRITVSSVIAYREAERPRRRKALEEFAALQNDLGLAE